MKKTILLADDEAIIATMVRMTLGGDERFEFHFAKDGEQALEMYQRHDPDLVFLDVRMPKRDGFEVCHVIKQDPAARAKVVMLTGLSPETYWDRAREAGADGYLSKPFRPSALASMIEETLAHPAHGGASVGLAEACRQDVA